MTGKDADLTACGCRPASGVNNTTTLQQTRTPAAAIPTPTSVTALAAATATASVIGFVAT